MQWFSWQCWQQSLQGGCCCGRARCPPPLHNTLSLLPQGFGGGGEVKRVRSHFVQQFLWKVDQAYQLKAKLQKLLQFLWPVDLALQLGSSQKLLRKYQRLNHFAWAGPFERSDVALEFLWSWCGVMLQNNAMIQPTILSLRGSQTVRLQANARVVFKGKWQVIECL